MADKSNAMKHAHELWYRCFFEVAKRYPGIEPKHVYVDAMCLYIIQDPSQFQVVVTCNLFGDIVTDLGAALQGGLGMAASANVHASDPKRVAMFEPVHGSAPPLAGKDLANPLASVLTVGMMLAHLGHPGEERRLETIVARAIAEKKCTRDVGGELGTRAVGDWVMKELGARRFSKAPPARAISGREVTRPARPSRPPRSSPSSRAGAMGRPTSM